MEENVRRVPKPICTRELFEELTSNPGLMLGLAACGELIDVRQVMNVIKGKVHAVIGIPIGSFINRHGRARQLWWVLSDDSKSFMATSSEDGGCWSVVWGCNKLRRKELMYNLDLVLDGIIEYLRRKIASGKLDAEDSQHHKLLLDWISRLATGELRR